MKAYVVLTIYNSISESITVYEQPRPCFLAVRRARTTSMYDRM